MKFSNPQHTEKARVALLIKQYNNGQSYTNIVNQFDKNGEVIRNHKKELEILHQDEQIHIISNAGINQLDSASLYKNYCEKVASQNPKVDKVKLAEFPKREPLKKVGVVKDLMINIVALSLKKLSHSLNGLF